MQQRTIVFFLFSVLCGAWPAAAQDAVIDKPAAGDRQAVVVISDPSGIDAVQIEIDRQPLAAADVVPGQARLVIPLDGQLRAGSRLRARVRRGTAWSDFGPPVPVAGDALAPVPAPRTVEWNDDRPTLGASTYAGFAYDNFAPDKVGNYINIEGAGRSPMRFITGVNVEYRLIGDPGDGLQMWWAAETLYGVRSADVNCKAEPQPPVCGELNQDFDERFLFILQRASSMEAFSGPRVEFLTLQKNSAFPSRVYASARFGFLALDDGTFKTSGAHHVGGGVLVPTGIFAGSFFEVGLGKTDLFESLRAGATPGRGPWNRIKVDGLLVFDLAHGLRDGFGVLSRVAGSSRFFVQVYSDHDGWGGTHSADSIQTFVGMDFDLRQVFGGGN